MPVPAYTSATSTEGTVELVKWAKGKGISITAEVTLHHLLLTDARLETYDPVNKGEPATAGGTRQLRHCAADLADGTIDRCRH